VLILNQFVVATMVLNTPQGTTTAGFTQGLLYIPGQAPDRVGDRRMGAQDHGGVLVIAPITHWGLGIRHHLRHRDRYLHRMLPFTHQK